MLRSSGSLGSKGHKVLRMVNKLMVIREMMVKSTNPWTMMNDSTVVKNSQAEMKKSTLMSVETSRSLKLIRGVEVIKINF